MGQEYPMQKPNVPYRNPFIMDPDNEDDSSDTNLLSCFWANNQKMIPNESPMKKENHLFEIKPMPIGHLPEFDDSDDFSIKTPKKPNSFLFNKAKSVFSSSRQEEKFPLNFKNFCPEQDFKNDYYNNISHSFSYPRQEKKFNPVWEQGKFLSDKKCVIFEKLSKNCILFFVRILFFQTKIWLIIYKIPQKGTLLIEVKEV